MAAPFNLNKQSGLNSEKNQIDAHDANRNPTVQAVRIGNQLRLDKDMSTAITEIDKLCDK